MGAQQLGRARRAMDFLAESTEGAPRDGALTGARRAQRTALGVAMIGPRYPSSPSTAPKSF